MSEKLQPIELEEGMVIWVKDFDEWAEIENVYHSLNRTSVKFVGKVTLTFDNRRRFKEW